MKKIVRLTENDITRIVKRVMNEAKESYDYPKQKTIGNIVGRKIKSMEDAIYYTKGTMVGADNIMRFLDKGHDIYVYINGDKRVFLDRTSGDAYSEKDQHILNVNRGGSFGSKYNELEDYLESSMDESLYEGYDYPKRKSIGTIKGRKLTLDNFSKYIMGTKISAKTIESYLEDGDDIIMYSNGPKRVFVNYTDGKAYNEKDRLITNIKRKESFDELEDYLES